MKKKLLCIALAFVFTVGLGLTAQAEDLALPAPSCILMEKDTGQILYESNAHEKLRPASVTKIMTLLLVHGGAGHRLASAGTTPSSTSAAAAGQGRQPGLSGGGRGAAASGRDAQIRRRARRRTTAPAALAEHVAGSESAPSFRAMNRARAAELGLTRHAFCQLHGAGRWAGRGHEHLTTALRHRRDVAVRF